MMDSVDEDGMKHGDRINFLLMKGGDNRKIRGKVLSTF